MKLLLDECVTRHLKRDLAGHEVHTVEEAGFKLLENGDLFRAASGAYEVLITVDRNLPYQQNCRSEYCHSEFLQRRETGSSEGWHHLVRHRIAIKRATARQQCSSLKPSN